MSNVECYTKLDLKQCTFSWKIDLFSILCEVKQNFKSSVFTSENDDFRWRLEVSFESRSTPSSESFNYIGSQRRCVTQIDYVCFLLHADSDVDLSKHSPVKGNGEFIVTSANGSKIDSRKFQLKLDVDKQYKTMKEFELGTVKNLAVDDVLSIVCHLKYVKKDDIFSIPTSSSITKPFKIAEPSLPRHLEQILNDGRFSDVTISVNGKTYDLHKAILAARSPVFSAMFSNYTMLENQKNEVEIKDIQQDIFEEMLYYIYTGTTRNLDELAFELIPVTDKYDLDELKNMCEQVMFNKLSLENAAEILMLADMHRAEELKAQTLQFIKRRSFSFKDFKNSDVWNVLTASRPQLMKDMLALFFE
ncbi:speckle-type POZ protein B-like [Planococcus citri]|uniref:speckle-type POZ protein B-like n=1 Tax=Planococcus citri TaxID=170843 RepID=UPI0031FA4799